MRTKNCGNCGEFTKWRNDKFSGGLCEELDVRTNTDSGHNCQYWRALKYERPKGFKIKDLTFD